VIAAAVYRLSAIAYRLVFFAAGIFLLWRGTIETDDMRIFTSIGLGVLCMLQFIVLAVIDYRRAQQRHGSR